MPTSPFKQCIKYERKDASRVNPVVHHARVQYTGKKNFFLKTTKLQNYNIIKKLVHTPCDTTITCVYYDEDPIPDYSGKVDGWTNDILYVCSEFIGTTDEYTCPRGCKCIGMLCTNSLQNTLDIIFPMLPFEVALCILEYIDFIGVAYLHNGRSSLVNQTLTGQYLNS